MRDLLAWKYYLYTTHDIESADRTLSYVKFPGAPAAAAHPPFSAYIILPGSGSLQSTNKTNKIIILLYR